MHPSIVRKKGKVEKITQPLTWQLADNGYLDFIIQLTKTSRQVLQLFKCSCKTT